MFELDGSSLYGQRSQSEAPLPILSEPRIFDIPSLLTPFFTGRDSHLDKLRDILQPPTKVETSDHDGVSYRRAVIHGVPGAGKTPLALKYASLYKEHYSAVFFVSAARIATLKDGYERIVSLLDLPQKSSDAQGVKVAATREWFEKSRSHCGRGWLLIVDNINSDNMNAVADDLVRDFLPRDSTTPRGSIILTTRNLRAAEIVVGGDTNLCIEAGEMNEQEAVDILSRASGKSDDRNSAHRIAKELGYLPLAINQAATYTKAVNVDFEHFLKNLREENDTTSRFFHFHRKIDIM
jgi:AAA domain